MRNITKQKPIKNKTEIKASTVKRVSQGDIIGGTTPKSIKERTIDKKIRAKINQETIVVADILKDKSNGKIANTLEYLQNYSVQEQKDILATLQNSLNEKPVKIHPDDELLSNW